MKPALCLLAAALPLAAQPKLLVNAQLKTQPAASGLESVFRGLLAAQPQPAWIAYPVPSTRTGNTGCEYVRDSFTTAGVVHLEPPDHVVMLYRVEANAVNRIRSLSPDCEIDAGGLPVYWLTGVQPAQSVALLASFLPQRDRLGDSMIGAIAQHADASADQVLEKLVAPGQPESVRSRAVTWLGSARGRSGFETLKRLIANDADERVREQAVNALATSKEKDAPELLVSIAQSDKSPKLRQQAVSAMSRKRDASVAPILAKVIETDPDLQVKRRAVSALNSLPDGEGIPALIQLIKTTRDPEIRKHAISTLGQSRDPRAVTFFEEVLNR
jgi:hypothetical protein